MTTSRVPPTALERLAFDREGPPRGIADPPSAAELRSNVPGSFAWGVFHDRHPRLLEQIRQAHPYPPAIRRALDDLLDETLHGKISPLPPTVHDHQVWHEWGAGHIGETWYDAPFLWAESYFYRRLLHAVGFFDPGPWQGVDPFAFLKNAELRDPDLDGELAALDGLDRLPDDERSQVLLLAALWGNRADLGFRIGQAASGAPAASSSGATAEAAGVVSDDRPALWTYLQTSGAHRVCLVADNAGRELLADLLLIDHLLTTGRAATVALHVKPYPYYVSDAVTADVVACLGRLAVAGGYAASAAHRLRSAAEEGRLAIVTRRFWCAPLPFHYLPADLAGDLAAASLTVLKGDLNYRRLVGDCVWPATMPFAEAAGYFPSPVVTLRTLKSDVVVGLTPDTVTALDAQGEPWRTSGAHGVVQARLVS